MVNKLLVDYIEKQLKNGIHMDRVKDSLTGVGHSIHDVEEAVKQVNNKKRNQIITYILIGLVIICILIFFSSVLIKDGVKHKTYQNNSIKIQNDSSIFHLALDSFNVGTCQKIISKDIRDKCILAVNMENNEKFKNTPGYALFSLAIENRDMFYCNMIQFNPLKELCMKRLEKSYQGQK